MLRPLPNEICAVIIAFLDADKANRGKHLQTTSLVSQSWCAFSRPRLFNPCPVFSFDSADAEKYHHEGIWLAALMEAPEASKQTRQINIRSWPRFRSRGAIHNIITLLSETFTEVEVIRIDLKHGVMPSSETASLILSFPLVHDLEVCIMNHKHSFPGRHLAPHFPNNIHDFSRNAVLLAPSV
jgi:hypothetical protein